MGILVADERRRVTLPVDAVKRYGQKFVAIETDKGILLKPLPRDPVKALEAEGRKIPKGVTIDAMKKEISKEALKYL
ncbi:MAG: AbrB family transcriptional regulator [Candidatus Aenigmarchaeota archaeon]|nr:AbrB family transcriptional regulator [Candidatus Aenigmarchaeota archaeon]